MYNGSDLHKQNLARARAAQVRDQKCDHCGEMHFRGNIAKHKKSCKSNPTNHKLCEICGSTFVGGSVTCSTACANTKFRSGPNNPNWKDESSSDSRSVAYRSTCFHYHEKKCVVCPEAIMVEVHHMDEDHTNNNPENLIPLCPTHHQYWHSRHRHLIEDRVRNYLNLWKDGRGGRI
jgi:predicted nucleic acid-binding Zn ribbon protein